VNFTFRCCRSTRAANVTEDICDEVGELRIQTWRMLVGTISHFMEIQSLDDIITAMAEFTLKNEA